MAFTPAQDKDRAQQLSSLGDRFGILEKALEETRALIGEIWECGSYKGGSGLYLAAHCRHLGLERNIRLFDTFAGMPHKSEVDTHKVGSFSDTNRDEVAALFTDYPNVTIHPGILPASFATLEGPIVVAHIDVDQHDAVRDCLAYVWPRMPLGGWVIIDDYNCGSCPGAKLATNAFVAEHRQILDAPGGFNPQARVIKRTPAA